VFWYVILKGCRFWVFGQAGCPVVLGSGMRVVSARRLGVDSCRCVGTVGFWCHARANGEWLMSEKAIPRLVRRAKGIALSYFGVKLRLEGRVRGVRSMIC